PSMRREGSASVAIRPLGSGSNAFRVVGISIRSQPKIDYAIRSNRRQCAPISGHAERRVITQIVADIARFIAPRRQVPDRVRGVSLLETTNKDNATNGSPCDSS